MVYSKVAIIFKFVTGFLVFVVLFRFCRDFGIFDVDDSVDIAGGIIEVGDGERVFVRWDLVSFRGRVDLEYMRSCVEDGLFFV